MGTNNPAGSLGGFYKRNGEKAHPLHYYYFSFSWVLEAHVY